MHGCGAAGFSPIVERVKEELLRLLAHKNYFPSNVPELLRLLHLPRDQQQVLQRALRELEQSGQVARIKGNRYVIPRQADLIPGRIRMTRQGRGVVRPDDSSLPEIAVAADATGTAMHEDRVLVRRELQLRTATSGAPGQPSGTVIRVLE